MSDGLEYGGWRAGVLHDDPVSFNVVLRIGRRVGDTVQSVVGIDGVSGLTLRTDPADSNVFETLRIPTELAMVLADALTRHFGGTSDSRTLRRDYDAERRRVDKLTDALIAQTA